MSTIVPPSRPQLARERVVDILSRHGVTESVALVGIPGYYRDTMGKPGVNDRGIYDDAIFLVSPHGFQAFNANVDPSIHRPGIATLKPGVWKYKLGTHGLSRPPNQRYEALVQAGPVTVSRDGRSDYDTGWFGINIHRGALGSTSSRGCQTIPPAQWPGFISLVKQELKRAGAKWLPYVLAPNAQ